MAKATPALESFNAGELSPDFAGRVTNEKYAVGCDTLENYIPMIQGPAKRRPGFRFVEPVANSANRTWLRKFIYSEDQAYQLEFGVGYIRFYTNHGQVTSGGNVYQIASPYTASMLTNADNTCGLQMEQSGDVVYIACAGTYPMTLKRLGNTNWTLTAYAPPDGPFLDQTPSNSPALYIATIAGSPNQVTCYATAAVFSPSDVATATTPGRLVRIGVQTYNISPWEQGVGYTANTLVRYNGCTFKCIYSGTSGNTPPTQTSGTQWDGAYQVGCLWLYQDCGYGIGYVSAYTSPTQVTLTVSAYAGQNNNPGMQLYGFPAATIGTVATVTGITNAAPAVVTAVGHGFSVGDPVYLTGIQGMTQISEQAFTIVAVTSNTFSLAGTDSTNYGTWASGGTQQAIKDATLNWQIGAWGIGSTQFPGTFPSSLAFFEDRLFWGGGIKWWGSAPGIYNSHTQDLYSLVTADCAVSGIIAFHQVDQITWMSAAIVLLIGTKGGEFALSALNQNAPIGPGNTSVERQSDIRSRPVRAEMIGVSNFYVQLGGKRVMKQDYNFYLNRYDSTNQTRLANHIAGYSVTSGLIDMDWHAEPYEVLWAVRNDGILVGYTFDSEDKVTGWHQHPLGSTIAGAAVVECVSVIPAPDGTRDEVWAIVNRTIGGVTVRSVEYMEKDYETGDSQSAACYVDMSGSYVGAPTTTITGLSYLNGETVSVLRDGGGHPDCVVSGGQITLALPGSVVQVGLACPANLIAMRLEAGSEQGGTAQAKIKTITRVAVRVKNTLGLVGGVEGGILDLLTPNESSTPLASPPPLFSGDVFVSTDNISDTDAKIQILQTNPFPSQITAIFPVIHVHEPIPQ
jgi:hypothetical protein